MGQNIVPIEPIYVTYYWMNSEKDETIKSTRKQALYLWAGLSLSLSLFYVQSQVVFIKSEPVPSSQLEWVFSVLGVVTFLFGFVFFKNYTALRQKKILKLPYPDRKQMILVAFVLQFILFETLGLYGVLLSVLTQNSLKAIPFLIFAYLGFALAFPRQEKVEQFFKN